MKRLLALMGFLLLPLSVGAPSLSPRVALAQETPVSYVVKMTAYNAVVAQTSANPLVTASGAFSNPEVVAARSRDLATQLPFGTVIRVERTASDTPSCLYSKVAPQIGYRVIADTMAARMHNKIDILLDQDNTVPVEGTDTNPGLALGICGGVKITVVGRVDITHMPKTQKALAALIDANDSSAIAMAR